MDLLGQIIFQTIVVVIGVEAVASCALLYFRWVRLERPPLGVFNNRDIGILLFFIVMLPLWYLILPHVALLGFLILTFSSALYMTLRPLIPTRYLWLLVLSLIGANIVVTETLLGTRPGWQLYWIFTDMVVLLAAVGVANLYVQGGMRLRHIAWFALLLAFYDAFFAFVIPITQKLAESFRGQLLNPSLGFSIGRYNASIGLGDLLVYGLFTVAAYKGFGRKGVITSYVIVTLFGALLPASTAPLIVTAFARSGLGIIVPVQIFFGPAAFLAYHWLARHRPERSMAHWLSIRAAVNHDSLSAPQRMRVVGARATLSTMDPSVDRAK